ncbi:MAG TPA: single-stranded DNA-binding protein, partial [Deltaproteobacteria bacterium]|nr:single-stranded DNA-binding protein [Deltaproteobacteria bacterium]
RTEWHRIVTWCKLAENCAKLLSKGKQVYVEGRLQTRQWDDRDGNKRYTTEVVAGQMQILSAVDSQGSRMADTSGDPGFNPDESLPSSPEFDDIPF